MACVAALASVVGCSRPTKGSSAVEIDLTELTRDSIPYSEFVDSISYIELEANDDCLLAEVHNLVMADSVMAVFDRRTQQVLLFGCDGHFVRKIGGRGQGPGEYMVAQNIDMDRDAGHLLVYDGLAVHRYTVYNEFVGRDSVGRGTDFAYLGGGKYLVTNNNAGIDDAGIYLAHSGMPVSQRVKLTGYCYDVPASMPYDFYRNDTVVSVMTRPYENRLLQWTCDSLSTILDFTVMQAPTEKEALRFRESPQDCLLYPNRSTFCNTDRWFYTYFWSSDNLWYLLYDRKTGVMELTNRPVNDIDGVSGLDMPSCIGGCVVRYCPPKGDADAPRLQFLHVKR